MMPTYRDHKAHLTHTHIYISFISIFFSIYFIINSFQFYFQYMYKYKHMHLYI